MQTWTHANHALLGDGPWADEPDKAQWVDEATDLDCLAVRGHHGAWCGYVGVPPGHPWHGVAYSHLDVICHDELSYSSLCVEEGEEPKICHVPEPGRPEHVWWIGFACMSFMDILPVYDQVIDRDFPAIGKPWIERKAEIGATYKPLWWVQREVGTLAAQVKAAA